MKLLKPDATTDGRIIFNFELKGKLRGKIVTIVKEVPDYKKATLKAAKDEAVAEAKAIVKVKNENKNKREAALAAIVAAGIVEEEIIITLN
jgi:hypothetical protein